jgi:hypothetical protein
LVLEGIAAISLDEDKCRVVEDKFVETEQDLNPSTSAHKKQYWQKLVQGECRKSRVTEAVRQVRESAEFVIVVSQNSKTCPRQHVMMP